MTLAQFVVVVAITLTTIAVALIVGAVILMEKEQKQGNAKDAQVAYLCDKNKKRTCGILTCGDCKHTTDVAHAKNFAREGDLYMEIEKDGEL